MLIASFVFFLLGFALIGALAIIRREHTTEDYLIAGKSVSPWLASLSAVATNNSGYMFIGMIGFTYAIGWPSIWLMIGWITGDLIASLLIMRKLREASGSLAIHSFGGLLSLWYGEPFPWLRRLVGAMVVVFLGVYSAAQLKAGSKALHVLLDWEPASGAVIGAVLILLYSYSGGLRASIWTDAAQSFVMIFAMALMMFIGLSHFGGVEATLARLDAVSPTYLNWFPEGGLTGALLFVGGWLFAGFGVAGQPHIVVRYMSLDDAGHLGRFRWYYYGWFTLFYGCVIVVGLLARIYLANPDSFDPELALPSMAMAMLPDVLVGLVLAGLFAATISTADSLVLSCSAAITRDFFHIEQDSYRTAKMATLLVVLIALYIALSGASSVFRLVLDAWGMLGSAFAPLLLIYALGGRPREWQAIVILLSGVAMFLGWDSLLAWIAPDSEISLYAIAPAIVTALLVWGLLHHLTPRLPTPSLEHDTSREHEHESGHEEEAEAWQAE